MGIIGRPVHRNSPHVADNRFSAQFLQQMRKNPLRAMATAVADDFPMGRIEAGPFRCHIVTDPNVAAQALTGSGERYRRTPDLAFWFPPAGEGVASSPHEKWMRQRRLIAPYFKASTEGALRQITEAETDSLIARIEDLRGKGPIELQAQVMETTLRIAVQHLLVHPFPVASAPISAAIQTAMHYATPGRAIKYRVLAPLNKGVALKALHPAPKRKALAVLDEFVDQLLALARRDPSVRAPMLQALFEADQEGLLDDGELRDQAATFLVAAVDSVGSAITWTLWHLAQYPEMAALAGNSEVWAEASALESMRRVPPLWIYWREATEAHQLAGAQIKRGDLVVFIPHVIHHRPEVWENPTSFDPSRFVSDGAIAGESGYRYMPFGHGGHACLGRRMAMTEARQIVHRLMKRYRISLDARTPGLGSDPLEVRVAVLMKGGLWARLEDASTG